MGPYVGIDHIPDSLPPFDAGADTLGPVVKADADGNVWIGVRLPKRLDGGVVYDVVNRQGKLVDRIQIPGGTTLVGFMPGFAYLMSRAGTGYTHRAHEDSRENSARINEHPPRRLRVYLGACR